MSTLISVYGDGICHRNDHQASLYQTRCAEIPITLHPDRRKAHPPHLKTFRDGWRTLRFFLMYSRRWLFLMPGLWLMPLGCLGYGIVMPGWTFHGVTFDAQPSSLPAWPSCVAISR